jgi:hypothetical protein
MDVAAIWPCSGFLSIPDGERAMSITEFDLNDPMISMGADMETGEASQRSREEQLQLQMRSLEIERQSPVNICVLEAALARL